MREEQMITESIEKGTEMMMKNLEAWQRMFSSQPWWPKELRSSALSQAEFCISSWRSAHEFNDRTRRIMRDQLDAMYSKMMREVQLYSQTHETQVKEFWQALNESEEARGRNVEDMFQRIEHLLKPEDGTGAGSEN